MDLKPIKTESDYNTALSEIEKLMGADVNTPEGDKLDILSTLVEAYEEKHYPVDPPDPTEAIIHQMECQSITRKDLEQYLGTIPCFRNTKSKTFIVASNDKEITKRIGHIC